MGFVMHIKVFLLSAVLLQSLCLMSMENVGQNYEIIDTKNDSQYNFFVNFGRLPNEIQDLLATNDEFELSDKSSEFFASTVLVGYSPSMLHQEKYHNIPKYLEITDELKNEWLKGLYRINYMKLSKATNSDALYLRDRGLKIVVNRAIEAFPFKKLTKLQPFVVHQINEKKSVIGYAQTYKDLAQEFLQEFFVQDFAVYLSLENGVVSTLKPPLLYQASVPESMKPQVCYTFIEFPQALTYNCQNQPSRLHDYDRSHETYLVYKQSSNHCIKILSRASAYNAIGGSDIESAASLLKDFFAHKHALSSLTSDPFALYEVTRVRKSLLNALDQRIKESKDKIKLQDALAILNDQSVFPQNIKGFYEGNKLSAKIYRLLKFE